MIEIIYGGEQKVPALAKNLMAKMLDDALKLTKQTAKMEVNFALVSAGEIKALNAEFRKVDKATDVLSFPSMSLVAGEKVTAKKAKEQSAVNPQTGNIMLGDILICTEVAKVQAKNFKHSLSVEIARLALHSLLHLLGYDHIADEDYKVMHALELAVLEKNNIKEN